MGASSAAIAIFEAIDVSEKFEKILDTIGDLYERAVAAQSPQETLGDLAKILGAQYFSVRTIEEQPRLLLSETSWNNWPHSPDYIKWASGNRDILTERLVEKPRDHIYHHDHIISWGDLQHTPYYNDFLRPIGYGGNIGCSLFCMNVGDGLTVRMSFINTGANPVENPWGSFNYKLLQRIFPHLRRAFRLLHLSAHTQDQSDSSTIPSAAAQSIIDRLTYGVIFINHAGNVRALNSAALRLIELNDGITVTHGKLRAANGRSDLHDLIQSVTAGQSTGGTIHVSRADGRSPLDIMVYDVDEGLLASQRGAMIVAIDPSVTLTASKQVLSRLGNLTPAETDLAIGLHAGMTRAEYAEMQKISLSAVKFHLTHLMEKIGAERQSDVVRWVTERLVLGNAQK